MSSKNIETLINSSAKLYKNKKYLISTTKKNYSITFNQLKLFKDCFRFFLKIEKVYKKNKILVLFENCDLLSLLFLSILGNGRVYVPINPQSSEKEISYIINLINPKIIIYDLDYKKKIHPNILKKINSIGIHDHYKFIEKIYAFKKPYKDCIVNSKQISQILFTSGSTGNPKGVVLTHESMMANLYGIQNRLNLFGGKNFLATTPLFHNNGQFTPTLLPLLIGGKTFPTRADTSIISFWSLCKDKKINYASLMSTHINYFVKMSLAHNLKYLKGIFCGGAKLDEDIRKKFEKKFKVKVITNYGLTETSSIIATEGLLSKDRRAHSVGKVLKNNKIKIIKKKKYINKNDNQIGEIYVKGDNVFKEYFRNKKLSNFIKKNDWLKTGDLGYLDKEKFLYIKDRVDNMFIVSGENVYPTEIEKYMYLFNEIKLGVVVAIPDTYTGFKPVLIYEGKKNIDYLKFKKKISQYLAPFKIPNKILHCSKISLSEIPKAPNKKILRSKLKNHVYKFLDLFK